MNLDMYSLPDDVSQEIDRVVFSTTDIDFVLDKILESTLTLLDADYGSLRLVDHDSNMLKLRAVRYRSGEEVVRENHPDFSLDEKTVMTSVVRQKRAIRIADIANSEYRKSYFPMNQQIVMRSELAVPLMLEDETIIIGVINVESPRPNAFSGSNEEQLVEFGRRATIALRRALLFDAIASLGQKVLSGSVSDLFEYVAITLSSILQISLCLITQIGSDGPDTTVVKSFGIKQFENDQGLSNALEDHHRKLLTERRPLTAWYSYAQNNVLTLLDSKELGEERTPVLSVPILDAQNVQLGVISAAGARDRVEFSSTEIDLVSSFASYVAVAIRQAQLFDADRRSSKQLRVVNAVLAQGVKANDLADVILAAVTEINRQYGYWTDIGLIDDGRLIFHTSVDYEGDLAEPFELDMNIGLTGAAVNKGRSISVSDITKDPRYYMLSADTKSELCVPLISTDGICIGVLNLESRQRNSFTEEDVTLFEAIASHISLTIENSQRRDYEQRKRSADEVLNLTMMVGASLAHKLGGSLGAFGLNMRELRMHVGDEDLRVNEILDTLAAIGEESLAIYERFRRFGRPDRLTENEIDLNSLINNVLSQLDNEQEIAVRKNVPKLPAIRANRAMLREIFDGICNNAIKAMPEGGELSVSARFLQGRHRLILTFLDTGTGMSEDVLDHVFTPFFTTRSDDVGLGIGLWLSRLYLRSLGGELSLNSTEGKGTKVDLLFLVPLGAGKLSQENQPSSNSGLQSPILTFDQSNADQKITALVIDDDVVFGKTIQGRLDYRNVETDLASSYEQGLELCRSWYDVYFIDIRLRHNITDRSGIDLATTVLREHPNARIVLMSSFPQALESAEDRFSSFERVTTVSKTDTNKMEQVLAWPTRTQ